ncbi:MAG: C69 family dipeptidase [Muribaculaceae bacterium]|nr:C69 family dipeptidase [Muribaculaceae bacterium]
MKRELLLLLAVLALCLPQSEACTSILVGKKASADGSVMCTYSIDSWGACHKMYRYEAGTHPAGTMRKIYDRDTRVYHGEIPEAPVTYLVTGNINEWQVAIAETTFEGREELINREGIIDYGSLMDLGLQRARTAREAISVMTSLAEEYGFCSSGESFTVCDPDEAWILELSGCGPGNKHVVWIAVRVPDNAVMAHANQSRIRRVDLTDKANVMISPNCISFARERGYFKGRDSEFSFCDAYNPPTFGGRRMGDSRVWAIYRRLTTGMDRYLPYVEGKQPMSEVEPLPMWIIPDQPLTVGDVIGCLRDRFEGTPLAMDDDPGAGVYDSPFRPQPSYYEDDSTTMFHERSVATTHTAFTWVCQLRGFMLREVGGVIWWGNDDSGMVAYTPVYCSANRVPHCYNDPNADAFTFSEESAYWVCNWVSNMVYPRWSLLYPELQEVRDSLQSSYFARQPEVEARALELMQRDRSAAINYLTAYGCEVGDQMLKRWREMAWHMVVKYNDGVIRQEEDGQYLRNSSGFRPKLTRPGMSPKARRRIHQSTGTRYEVPKAESPDASYM